MTSMCVFFANIGYYLIARDLDDVNELFDETVYSRKESGCGGPEIVDVSWRVYSETVGDSDGETEVEWKKVDDEELLELRVGEGDNERVIKTCKEWAAQGRGALAIPEYGVRGLRYARELLMQQATDNLYRVLVP